MNAFQTVKDNKIICWEKSLFLFFINYNVTMCTFEISELSYQLYTVACDDRGFLPLHLLFP